MLNTLLFEQPMNEQLRIYLKLEYLFAQVDDSIKHEDSINSRQGLEAIVQALSILDRSDFKSKLVKELHRVLQVITRLASSDKIDHEKVSSLMHELNQLIELLHSTSGKIGQSLRDSEFLNSIRQSQQALGGLCGFELPSFWLWIHQNANARQQDLKSCLEDFDTLRRALNLLLKVYRESAITQNRIAENGFYQMGLDPQAPIQLLQIQLPKQSPFYPEMSIGRHGVSVRFYQLAPCGKRRTAVEQNVAFKIMVCAI